MSERYRQTETEKAEVGPGERKERKTVLCYQMTDQAILDEVLNRPT